jgi:hypothetical protein
MTLRWSGRVIDRVPSSDVGQERRAPGLGAVLSGSMRWALAGYALPAILISVFFLLIRNGPATAHSYNYGLSLFVVLLIAACIAAGCLGVAVSLAIKSLRHGPKSVEWPHYAVLLTAVAPTAVAALWLIQS